MAQISDANAQALIGILQGILKDLGAGGPATDDRIERLRDEQAGLNDASAEFLEIQRKIYEVEAERAPANSEARKQALSDIRKINSQLEEQKNKQEDLNQELAKADVILKNYAGALFNTSGALQDLYKNYIPKTTKEFEAMGMQLAKSMNGFKAWGKTLDTIVVAGTMKIANEFMKLALAQDEASAKFRQATGLGTEFASTITHIRNANRAAGITHKEAGEAVGVLADNMSAFTLLDGPSRNMLGNTTALLTELGVAGSTTGRALDTATKSLGATVPEANAIMHRLRDTATSLGQPINKVVEDFVNASPKLAFYGKEMMGVFEQLSKQAKVTGLSVDQLLGVVGEKFDTFEGAGQAVGKLNAILGGPYLNSIDMLNATEAERMEMIKASVDAAGIQFDQLNKFEQKAFASALGTDVDTLRRSMMNLSEAEQLNIIKQERLAETAASVQSMMDELKSAIASLVLDNKDLFDGIVQGVKDFSKFLRTIDDTQKAAIRAKLEFGLLFGAIYMGTKFVFGLARGFGMLAKVLGVGRAAAGAAGAGGAAGGGGAAAGGGLIGGLKVMGSTLAKMAVPIAAVTGGITTLYGAFSGLIASLAAGGSVGDVFAGALLGIAKSMSTLLNTVSFGGFGKLIEFMTGGMTLDQLYGSSDAAQGAGFSKAATAVLPARSGGQTVRPTSMPRMAPSSQPAAGGAQAQLGDVNVVVKIGEKELNGAMIASLDSTIGRQSLTPRYQG